jgi:hypothetical protein
MLVFVVNEAGRCLYYFYGRGEGLVLFSYVDDVLIFGISLNLIKEVKDFLFNNFVLSPCSRHIAHLFLAIHSMTKDNIYFSTCMTTFLWLFTGLYCIPRLASTVVYDISKLPM